MLQLPALNDSPMQWATVAALIVLALLAGQPAQSGHPYYFTKYPLIVWQASPYEWITDKRIENGVRANLLLIRMAQNEREHASFAMTNNTDSAMSVAVKIECEGVPAEAIELRKVAMLEGEKMGGSVAINEFNEAWPKPELLEAVKDSVELAPKSSAHLWITINSRNVSSGTHRGWVTLTAAGSSDAPTKIPLKVEVWPFRLPDNSGLHTALFYHLTGPAKLAEKVARLSKDHGVDVVLFEVPPIENGKVDTAKNDWLERLRIARKYDLTPLLQARELTLVQIRTLGPLDPIIRGLGFEPWLADMSAEPEWSEVPDVIERCKALKEVCPSVMTFHAIWHGFLNGDKWELSALKELSGNIGMYNLFRNYTLTDIFHINRWRTWPVEMVDLLAAEQKKGRWITFYHNNYRAVSYPNASLAWFRPDGWYAWRYGFDGYRSWCGRSVPYYGLPDYLGIAGHELPVEKQPLGFFFYVRKVGSDDYDLLSCKRLEAWADGVRDYVYLCVIDDLIHQAETSGKPKLAEMVKAARETIDDCYEEVRLNTTSFYAYSNAKRRLAEEIVRFSEAGLHPKLNPDGSVVNHRTITRDLGYPPEEGATERIEIQGAL